MTLHVFWLTLAVETAIFLVLMVRLHGYRNDRAGAQSRAGILDLLSHNITLLSRSTYNARGRRLLPFAWMTWSLIIVTLLIHSCSFTSKGNSPPVPTVQSPPSQ